MLRDGLKRIRADDGRWRKLIRIKHHGDFKHTETLFENINKRSYLKALKKYGEAGVEALASATPEDTGETAASWSYEIVANRGGYAIYWNNSHVNKGVNIALILQYGHGTGTGGYVKGIDYINPAIRSVFDDLANAAWREVMAG